MKERSKQANILGRADICTRRDWNKLSWQLLGIFASSCEQFSTTSNGSLLLLSLLLLSWQIPTRKGTNSPAMQSKCSKIERKRQKPSLPSFLICYVSIFNDANYVLTRISKFDHFGKDLGYQIRYYYPVVRIVGDIFDTMGNYRTIIIPRSERV